MRKAKLEQLEWPGNSPDQNPIEILWATLKSHVDARKTSSVPGLNRCIEAVWNTELIHGHGQGSQGEGKITWVILKGEYQWSAPDFFR